MNKCESPIILDNCTQPIINIGCLGSVSHGKTTMVKLLSGKSTQQHSKEKVRNITMKVGYANCKIYLDDFGFYTLEKTDKLVNYFSFVDCPGHHELIDVMMKGAYLMNYGIVVIAGNQSIEDQPQLKQHLLTAQMIGIKKLIFLLNKLDLVTETMAQERKYELEEFLKQFDIIKPIIIPMALNYGINKEYLIDAIMNEFSLITEFRDTKNIFSISRSFNINKPGKDPKTISGGVIGGCVTNGTFELNDNIIISPGQIKFNSKENKWYVKQHKSKVVSLESEKIQLDKISCGGLTSMGLEIDPYFAINDKLEGNIAHTEDVELDIYSKINCNIEYTINKSSLVKGQIYNLQVGCCKLTGKLLMYKDNKSKNNKSNKITCVFDLNKPVCCIKDNKILISKQVDKSIELIGYGIITDGEGVIII